MLHDRDSGPPLHPPPQRHPAAPLLPAHSLRAHGACGRQINKIISMNADDIARKKAAA